MGKKANRDTDNEPVNEFARAFGERLRAARAARTPPATGADLAAQIGANKTNVSHWETGKHMPKLEALTAICDYLGCSADSLLGREKHGLSAAALAEAKAFDALSPEEQKRWRAMRLTLFASMA